MLYLYIDHHLLCFTSIGIAYPEHMVIICCTKLHFIIALYLEPMYHYYIYNARENGSAVDSYFLEISYTPILGYIYSNPFHPFKLFTKLHFIRFKSAALLKLLF